MSYKKSILITIICVFTITATTFCQGRLKVGGGVSYVTNDFKQKEHLNNYFAPSANINYTFLRKAGFGLALESATTFKASATQNDEERSLGFTSSLPIIASYNLKKTGLYAGGGPAYIKQTEKTKLYNERVSDYFLNTIAGVSFKGPSILGDLVYFEYNVRISYFKNLRNSTGDAGILSFIVFLKA